MSRRLSSLAGTILLVVLFGVWFGLFRPVSLGGPATWVVIRGSSMLPVYDTGDLVIMHAASAYSVGDIVAYRVPAGEIGEGRVVVHRLVGGSSSGFEVLGDNNESVDPWHPSSADILGRPWITLPGVGRVITWLHQPVVLAALAAAVVVSMLVGGASPEGHERRRREIAPEAEPAAPPS
ncbi:MAG: signal peptidase I [Chloroflexi bacterium]|nr:signal peptidase I [Chloroflexota bacterium]